MNVKNFIDLHVHIGPEIIPRKFTVQEIVKEEKGKLAGMALKNHFYPTTPMIGSSRENNPILIGSITLNNYIGGLNADAVRSAAEISKKPIIVWFPTINAANFLRRSEYEIPKEWAGKDIDSKPSKKVNGINVLDKKGNLSESTIMVLKSIKENNCILATGHISWQESKKLVEEAVKMGIKKIIITHPIYQKINMPLNVQKELARNDGVYIEQCYSMYSIDKISITKITNQIKSVGAEKCILTSDVGQLKSPAPSKALKKFAKLLKKQGVTEKEIELMGSKNPRTLIAQIA
ncbi:MAG: hypothetical protein HY515_03725 [Candidatus Aenigmarchaeota archaeon]|nr:hypothetical protein [Candidatus Aenigmarchaeota archaeon]